MSDEPAKTPTQTTGPTAVPAPEAAPKPGEKPRETGGPKGLEPTRYGDWEKGGRCIDF